MAMLQDESAGSLSTGSGLELDEGEEVLGEELREDDNVQLGSDDDFWDGHINKEVIMLCYQHIIHIQ